MRETLRVTPAMELGIPDYVWEIEEIVYPRSPRADLSDKPEHEQHEHRGCHENSRRCNNDVQNL